MAAVTDVRERVERTKPKYPGKSYPRAQNDLKNERNVRVGRRILHSDELFIFSSLEPNVSHERISEASSQPP